MSDIELSITGIDVIMRNLDKFKAEIDRYLGAAGQQAAQEILRTPGLKQYPPATTANAPGRTKIVTFRGGKTASFRMGYYIRGRGMQTPTRGGGYKDLANSERLGTQWTVTRSGRNTKVGNRSSYAPYVHGDQQPDYMAAIGWRKLDEVADENIVRINEIYQEWINKLISDTGME